MAQVLALLNHRCETTGIIGDVLTSMGIMQRTVRSFDGDQLPRELGDVGGLLVMGGPMGVYEHESYPFLKDEMRLIDEALLRETPVLGICLGSQLLATALGAEVRPAPRKEIGWHEVVLSPAAANDSLLQGVATRFVALHWHGDAFPLPEGATALASSDLTRYQAFRHGSNAYGFLFHMEITTQGLAGMVGEFGAELDEAGVDGEHVISQGAGLLPGLGVIGRTVFRRWACMVEVSAGRQGQAD